METQYYDGRWTVEFSRGDVTALAAELRSLERERTIRRERCPKLCIFADFLFQRLPAKTRKK